MKVGKAIYNILSQSTDVQSNFPFNTTDYSPTGTELVENGEFDELGTDVITNGGFTGVTELITNGDFSNGINNWTPNANATLTIDNNKLKVAISGGSGYPSQSVTTEIGKTYKVTADAFIGTSSRLAVYNSADSQFRNLYADGSFDFTITATSTSTQLRLYVYDNGAYGLWDNVSVKEVGEDWTNGIGWSFGEDKAISTQALGSEEVTNGDFSAAGINLVDNPNFTDTGGEIITNGDFATGDMTGWNAGSSGDGVTPTAVSDGSGGYGALISNGVTSGNSYMIQNSVFEGGKSYKVSYRIVSNSLPLTNFLALEDYDVAIPSTVGTHDIFVVGLSTELRAVFKRAGGQPNTNIVITDISVKELGADWTLQNGWSIGDEVAIFQSTVSAYRKLYQENFITIGKSYKLTFEITSISSGSIANFEPGSPSFNTIGVKTQYYIATYDDLYLEPTNDANLTVTNISVQELGEGWTVETGWTFGDGVAICDGSGANDLLYQSSLPSGDDKWFKVTFTISSYTSGTVYPLFLVDGSFIARNAVGTYTIYGVRQYSNNYIYLRGVNFVGEVSNYSVQEIATSYLTQAVSLSAKTWKIIYSVSDYIAGSVSATDYGAVTTANAVGITEYVPIGVASNFRMVNIDGYFEGAVTDISAQLVDPNGYWTLGTGWTFGEDVAISDGSVGFITQSILTADTSYKITVKVTGNPTLLVFSSTSFYGDEATRTLKNGTHTYYLQAKAATFSITNEGGDACTITNISVEEVVLNKIFPELAPPDIDAPYIVYSVVSNSPSETKNANGDIDTASIEVYGFQDTYNKAVDLGVSVRAALDRKTGTYNTIEIQSTNYVNEQMDVNEARKLWAAIQDYSIRIKNL